jgi:thymidylate synthase ThyX
MIESALTDPAMPVFWGKNQKGMQAVEELSGFDLDNAKFRWIEARDNAIKSARDLIRLGLHKQIVNRLLEPWMWITVIVSSTEFNNFFNLRCHKDAQPEIQKIARLMLGEYQQSVPWTVKSGEWHLPLLPDQVELEYEWEPEYVRKISVGRCARVSYLTYDGKRDPKADIDLHDNRLLHPSNPDDPDHMSPFEHVAMASPGERSGNFTGWHQYRKDFPSENRTTLREELR